MSCSEAMHLYVQAIEVVDADWPTLALALALALALTLALTLTLTLALTL